MKIAMSLTAVMLFSHTILVADLPKPLVTGLTNPESVCVGMDGAIYVTEIGEFGKDGDGKVTVIRDGKPVTFAKNLDDPKGIVVYQNVLYLTDKNRVAKVTADGSVSVLVAADQFPVMPRFLNDIEIDPATGTLYVSDSGNLQGEQGAVFSITVKTGKAVLFLDAKKLPGLHTPNGLAMHGTTHLLLVDFGSGNLYRISVKDQTAEKVSEGFEGADGLTWDRQSRLFITSWKTGKVFIIPQLGDQPQLVSDQFSQAADSCLDATGKFILIPDMKQGTLTAIPAQTP